MGGVGKAKKHATACLGRNRGFLVAIEFLVLCRDRGSLCHDIVLRFKQWKLSQHGSLCCDRVLGKQ